MTCSLSPRIRASLALVGVWATAALLSGHAELTVLAVPFIVFVAVGLVSGDKPRIDATIELDEARLLEGDRARVQVVLHNQTQSPVELEIALAHTASLKLEPPA